MTTIIITSEVFAALPLYAAGVSVFLLIMGKLNGERAMEAVACVCLIVSLVLLALGPYGFGVWS